VKNWIQTAYEQEEHLLDGIPPTTAKQTRIPSSGDPIRSETGIRIMMRITPKHYSCLLCCPIRKFRPNPSTFSSYRAQRSKTDIQTDRPQQLHNPGGIKCDVGVLVSQWLTPSHFLLDCRAYAFMSHGARWRRCTHISKGA